MWLHKELMLKAKPRGFHLITAEVLRQLPELNQLTVGLCHIFIKHSSASLTINENADPTVRQDFEQFFNKAVPENEPYYTHTYEGSDDLPAHIKSSLLGSSVSIPVTDGSLCLGTWQGLYLGEHRNHASGRTVVVTLHGE